MPIWEIAYYVKNSLDLIFEDSPTIKNMDPGDKSLFIAFLINELQNKYKEVLKEC